MGTEAAMLCISGTMANLCALLVYTQPGDVFFADRDTHIHYLEKGYDTVARIKPSFVESTGGLIGPDALRSALSAPDHGGKLLCLENPHNRGGGRILPLDLHAELCAIAHDHGLPVHIDGARIFNAAVAAGKPVSEWARHADSIMFCLSKSLSCPLGSVLCGTRDFIREAWKARVPLGGGMRQAGLIAATGLVALETMVDRLSEDHALARTLAEGIVDVPGLSLDLDSVQTNMVVPYVDPGGESPEDWVAALETRGIRASIHPPDRLRFVTTRHHSPGDIEHAVAAVRQSAAAR
jgi:threonine aldolase